MILISYIFQGINFVQDRYGRRPLPTENDIKDLYQGAHIKFRRFQGLYCHHAIVTYIDKTRREVIVAHCSAEGTSYKDQKSVIMEKTLDSTDLTNYLLIEYTQIPLFSRNTSVILKYKSFEINLTLDKPEYQVTYKSRFPYNVSKEIATYFNENKSEFGQYHALNNNCEHFVFACTTGYKMSYQQYKFLKASPFIVRTFLPDLVTIPITHVAEYENGNDFWTMKSSNGDKRFDITFTSK